jgi:hypothetical protein
MAIEYIAGKDLGKIARRLARRDHVMPPVVAAFIAARLCDALDYAHSLRNSNGSNAGVVHRDLSPSNIIVSYEGGVKLIDFGLAKAVGRAQQTNVDALKKKLGYMSPEMVKGRPLDSRSDIFGVGVVLYEMLTGRRLFVGKDDIDTLKLVGIAAVPPPSAVSDDVPDDLEVVVMRALEKEPDDRFQNAAEMGQILNAFVQRAHGSFTTNALSDWITTLFADEVVRENERIKRLLEASADPELLAVRRTYFASPTGAAARARAEIHRRMSTEPPAMRMPMPIATAPKAARVPQELSRDNGPHDDGPTGFYDRDGSVNAQGVHDAPTRVAPEPTEPRPDDAFYDEPTSFVPDPAVPPPSPVQLVGFDSRPPEQAGAFWNPSVPPGPNGGFEEEKTQFLQELELEAMIIPGPNGGFEEEPTHIFFNKEEGIGVPALLREINDVEEPARGLNKPIIAEDLGLVPSAALSNSAPRPRLSTPPMGSGAMPLPLMPPPAAGARTRSGEQLIAPLPEQPPFDPSQAPPSSMRPVRHTARIDVRPQPGASWPLVLTAILLVGAIGALVWLTPVAITLGLRPPTVGSIEVRTDPPAKVSVLLDDIHRGAAPLRLDRVPAGSHRITVRGNGYLDASREIKVSTGKTMLLHIALVPEKASAQP